MLNAKQSIQELIKPSFGLALGNITVCGKRCTVEFQPSANMCWQSWVNSEVNQAATYRSPFTNVHKGSFCTMGGIDWVLAI